MGRGRIFILLALLIILILVAVFVVTQRLNIGGPGPATEATPVPVVEEVDVVVTTQRIQRGEEIDEELIQVVSIPRDLLVDGMVTNPSDATGLRAKFDLDSGIPLTRNMLVETVEQLSDAGSVASLLIPPGKVAVSIPINRLSSVSYGLERGDQVNVIVTMPFVDLDADYQSLLPNNTSAVLAPGPVALLTIEGEETTESQLVTGNEIAPLQNLSAQSATGGEVSPQGRVELDPNLGQPFYVVPSEPQRPRLVSQTLIQGAIVLQVGTFPLPGEPSPEDLLQQEPTPAPEEPAPGPAEEEEAAPTGPEPPEVITLVVDPQDAVTLNYLIFNKAQLALAMRAAEDDTMVDTEAVTLQFLLDEYNIPVPAKLPFGTEPRIDELTIPTFRSEVEPTPTP